MAEEIKPSTVNPNSFNLRLFNHDSQAWEEANPDDAYQKILSGNYTFESGIKIPVVNSQGQVGSIDSDNAYNEFKSNGIRPLTQQISNLNEDIQKDKINQKIYGDRPVDAFIQGALRATTLGLSDVAFNAIGVDEGARLTEELNSGSSLGGEIAGTIATALRTGPAGGGAALFAGKSAGQAAKAALGLGTKGLVNTGRAAGVGARAVAETAGELAGKLGANKAITDAAKLTAEGAYYGLGQGISEAALGDPESVVDTLVANVGAGALFGGATGAVFGAARGATPFVQKQVTRALEGSSDFVNAASRATLKKGLVPALKAQGREDLIPGMAKAIDDVEGRQVAATMDMGKAEKEIGKSLKEAKKFVGQEKKELVNILRGQSDQARNLSISFAEQAGKNIKAAAELADNSFSEATRQMEDVISSGVNRPIVGNPEIFSKNIDQAVTRLNAMGTDVAKDTARKLEAIGIFNGGIANQADEASMYFKLLNMPGRNLEVNNLLKPLKGMADDYFRNADPMLEMKYKDWGAFKEARDGYRKLSDHVLKTVGIFDKVKDVSARKALKTLISPENRAAITTFLDNIDKFGDDFKALNELGKVRESVQKVAKQQAFVDSVNSRMRNLGVNNADVDEIADVMKLFGKDADFVGRIDRLRDVQAGIVEAAAGGTGVSNVDKFIALARATGKDVGPEMHALSKIQGTLSTLEQLGTISAPGFDKTKGLLGGIVGNLPGLLLGLQKSNVKNYVDALTALEASTRTGAKALDSAMKYATGVITGNKAQNVVKFPGLINNPSLSEQKKTYRDMRKLIAESFTERPVQHDAAPNVFKAIEKKRQDALKFLESKMPEDPFQEHSFNFNDSGYLPSDYELSKFYRYVNTVNNPQSAIKNIANNKVTPEEMETLSTVYPKIYQQLQNDVLDGIIKAGGKIPYNQRVNLATIFNVPTDYTMQPDFIARMQASINAEEGGRPQGSESSTKKIEIDLSPKDSVMTQAQRTTYKV